jgi:hypothetical protein
VKRANDEQVAPQLPARTLAAADAKLSSVEAEVQDKVRRPADDAHLYTSKLAIFGKPACLF